MTKVLFENENGAFQASVDQTEMTLREVMESLVHPVLLAAGYQPESIQQATGKYHDDKETSIGIANTEKSKVSSR